MNELTDLIRSEIKRQYKSVLKFSEASGIPYSTLSNALSKGIGGTSYDTVIKVCNLLNLKQVYDCEVTMFNEKFYNICSMLMDLDEQGVHTVETILALEHDRCKDLHDTPTVQSFNGLAYAAAQRNQKQLEKKQKKQSEEKQ